MKKVVLVIALFLGFVVQGQNQDIINKMVESRTIEDIKVVANDIVSKSKNKYDFYKIVKRSNGSGENYQYIIYTKEGMSDNEKKELSSNSYINCLVVKFKEWNKGENTDLEIKGELVYYFKEISGKYLDLVEFWTTTFYPGVTKEQVLDNYKLQEYRINKDLKYKFKKDNDVWTISKSY